MKPDKTGDVCESEELGDYELLEQRKEEKEKLDHENQWNQEGTMKPRKPVET